MFGRWVLCKLRISVRPFPMWLALPTSEYYGRIRLPIDHQPPSLYVGLIYHLLDDSKKVETIGSPRFIMLLDTHATLFVNSDRPSGISPWRFLCVGFRLVNTLAVCFFNCLRSYITLWGVRSPLRPMYCPVYASAISFGYIFLLNSCNTRYRWLAKPCLAWTYTLPEALSFS